jgi:hypothetical protein
MKCVARPASSAQFSSGAGPRRATRRWMPNMPLANNGNFLINANVLH